MCFAISLADSTNSWPSFVLLLLDRLEDFREGLFFGCTEILLLVLGIYGDEVYELRRGKIVNCPYMPRFPPPLRAHRAFRLPPPPGMRG